MKYYICRICNKPITDKVKIVKKIEKGYAFRCCSNTIERYKTKTYYCRDCHNEIVNSISDLVYKAVLEQQKGEL